MDKNTGQLRVANTIDRESKFVSDAMYNVTMKAVDASKFTAPCCRSSVIGKKFTFFQSYFSLLNFVDKSKKNQNRTFRHF